ncbi:hypothetical protein KUW17_00945 [Leisingera aquaemixtae]|uniref:DUF6236 family protein n=1 Tax=Leisingera aquaemixtae TaxID=1396826 RepID=UPI001C94806B|nr:hypothetical protein [Leisingera aquaemixtae]MBY6065291.1 hypothetical protein [Leisingera aquaemixtae]
MLKNGVILPPISISSEDSFYMPGDVLLSSNLNRALLYWEDVAAPLLTNPRLIQTPYSEKLIALHKEDLIGIPQYFETMSAVSYSTQLNNKRLLRLYETKRNTPGENWALLPVEEEGNISNLSILSEDLGVSRQSALHMQLAKKLPVPSGTVNPKKIIEFRENNLSALRSVHYALNELSAKYQSLSDEEEPLLQAQARLEDELDGYITKAQASVAKGGLVTLEYAVAITTAVAGAAAGGIPGTVLGAIAGLGGAKLISTIQSKIPKPETSSPYAFALRAADL